MQSLSRELRNQLAATVKAARRAGESGARNALAVLAVGDARPHESLSPDGQDLRRRLRAHGRQLGDRLDAETGVQQVERLVHEVAYEHWHRMLFARFLAENGLLIEPESGVAVSLTDCEELAREQGQDCWTVAGRFAERMLPRIFRSDDPALAVPLAPETRQALERLLESLPAAVFAARDSLGWTYQFWQAERKEAVNKSGVKIGADELPAVTQLFTERYMVLFLLHNTVGAWRAGRVLAAQPELAATAASEEELRRAVRLEAAGGYGFSYLRFVREPREGDEEEQPTGPWRPAAGTFAGWPRLAADLRVLDPCCGSGHFLVECLDLLARLRMEEERLAPGAAIEAVLRDNLFGLEIDPRCTQIAAFNLALAAWTWSGAGGYRLLPALNLACSGLAPNATRDDWTAMAEAAADAGGLPAPRDLLGVDDSLMSAPLRHSLGALHDLFVQAPVLGSLIDPRAVQADLFQHDYESARAMLGALLDREGVNEEQAERAVAARGMARAAELLVRRYHLVITNVPYLARGKFLTSYRTLRETLLKRRVWNLVARLGEHAFKDSQAAGAFVALNVRVYWESGRGALCNSPTAHNFPSEVMHGKKVLGKTGLRVTQMRGLPVTIYTGELFGKNGATVVPDDPSHLPAIWCFCSSPQYNRAVRKIDQKLNVTNATLAKVEFDLAHWTAVAEGSYPNGLPEPYSNDPTQWVFHGHPCGSVGWDDEAKRTSQRPLRVGAAVLQVAVARLLGYRWSAERDPAMRLADEAHAWAERCDELAGLVDTDGIVCLSAVGGEPAAGERLRRLLAAGYGAAWSAAVERRLVAAAAGSGRPAESSEVWLRDRFFEQHCQLFHQRPFVWHVWDGRRDGFHALVNYHRLAGPDGEGRRTLETLTYRYLGEWLARQRAGRNQGVEGADGRLAAAQDLQSQLARILTGEPPCDLFARWKPLGEQPIGWEPDINDGVRINIRPFMAAELTRGGRAGAGVLRVRPRIAWGKDRGKEALGARKRWRPAWTEDDHNDDAEIDEDRELRAREHYPWFWGCPGDGAEAERTDFAGGPEFDGNRWNDLHYTNWAKRAARERRMAEVG